MHLKNLMYLKYVMQIYFPRCVFESEIISKKTKVKYFQDLALWLRRIFTRLGKPTPTIKLRVSRMFTEDVVKGSLFRLSFSFYLSCWSRNEGKTHFCWPSDCRLFVVLPLEVLFVILYFILVMRLRNSMPKQINVYVYIYI